jgi:serine/threonine protein kinase
LVNTGKYTRHQEASDEKSFIQQSIPTVFLVLSALIQFNAIKLFTVFRDLRSKNILISSGNVIKIADFGISKSFTETHCSLFSSQVGNPHWRAPELIEGRGNCLSRIILKLFSAFCTVL